MNILTKISNASAGDWNAGVGVDNMLKSLLELLSDEASTRLSSHTFDVLLDVVKRSRSGSAKAMEVVRQDAALPRYRLGRVDVVAGDHLDIDAGGVAGLHGFPNRRTRLLACTRRWGHHRRCRLPGTPGRVCAAPHTRTRRWRWPPASSSLL